MSYLEVSGIRKTYGSVTAVDDVSFELEEGDLLTLLGPSGCGKTTTLDVIAGLTEPDRGEVRIDGRDVTDLPPEHRDTVKVFQEYALFPHMTVGRNVGFGLEMEGVSADEREERIAEALRMVELEGLADRAVDELSGGQRQRVATARALVKEPAVLLLDEPFSALDLKLREQLQIELRKLQERLGITTVHVTHDQEEAMILSDKVIVMNDGAKLQEGPPGEIYESPTNRFVANFIGKSNLLEGRIVAATDAGYVAESADAGRRFEGTPSGGDVGVGDEVAICLRPEKCTLRADAATDGAGPNRLPATVEHRFLLGAMVQYRLSVAESVTGDQGREEFVVEDKNLGPAAGFDRDARVVVECAPEHVKLIPAPGGV
jgi:ABC-type Fe3+/spermidine/putrescine transport system ATPase subunit